MKCRFHNNEIRIRLALAEVAALCDGREVRTQVRMGPEPHQVLSFEVRPDRIPMMQLDYTAGNVLVRVPVTLLEGWLQDAREGFSRQQYVDDSTTLNIILQKDYVAQPLLNEPDGEDTFEWNKAELLPGLGMDDD